MILALKLVLVPFFLGLISLAGKRFGPSTAGWLAGMPVIVGPILFLLALQNGAAFAADAAVHTLASVLTVIAFGVGYAWAAMRWTWPRSLAVALAAWLVAAGIVSAATFTVLSAACLALGTLIAARWLYPNTPAVHKRASLPRHELAIRMGLGALLTLVVTTFAASVGTALSGVAALAPVLTPVIAVFMHRGDGAMHAISMLRSLAGGLYSLAAFCFVIAWQLASLGITRTFLLAIGVAIGVQSVSWWVRRERLTR
jgi:hypothetical protein